jgi:hypothetical protein
MADVPILVVSPDVPGAHRQIRSGDVPVDGDGIPISIGGGAYGAPVQDLTALAAVPPASRFDKQQRGVEDERTEYYFDADSAAAADGFLIIAPDTGTGRWFRQQARVNSVFGRISDVVAAASDYDASQVDNDSGVTGATVKAALDTLDSVLSDGVLRAFRNDTGAQLDAGDLVYISGRDAGSDLPTVTKAKADAATTMAEFVVAEDVADGANGNLARRLVIRGLDTSGRAAGDRVYLSSAAAGAWTATAPSAANFAQLVGRVTEVNVATGEVEFFIDKAPIPDNTGLEYAASDLLQLKDGGVLEAKIGTNAVTQTKINADAVTQAKIADDAVQKEHLHDELADLIPQLADITNDNEGDTFPNNIRFTLQVQDAQGNNLAKRCTLFVYISDSAFGDPVTITTLTANTGTDITITLARSIMVITEVNGQARIDVEWVGAGTRYLMASVGGASVKQKSATWS